MIKPQDLRIGNWLIDGNGSYYQVGVADLALLLSRPDTKECNPILLSAGILEKAGFMCHDYGNRKKYFFGDFEISLYPNGEFIFMWNGQVVYIKSVHHLQNLYWSLCGEELPVELY